MLKSKKTRIILASVAVIIALSITVFAEDISKTINAVYMNVKLVVDGIQIEPKDANGNYVEPFIYNGTTYLPVRAVGEALGKDVSWDGNTATVYIGGEVEKPAKDVLMWNKVYLEAENKNLFSTYEQEGHYYHAFNFYDIRYKENASTYVIYPLNGLCKSISGKILDISKDNSTNEFSLKFFDENDNLLYTSPTITNSTEDIPFKFDTPNVLNIKIVANWKGNGFNVPEFGIKDLTFTTTDY